MYQIEEIKKSYTRMKKRVERIVIGGIAFIAAVISVPASGTDAAQYDYYLTASVEKAIEKKGMANDHAAAQLFTPALPAAEDAAMSKWTDELFELEEYEDDWDGEGAMAVHPDSIQTAHELMKGTADVIAGLSDIYPTPLGTICMEWRHHDSAIIAEIARRRIALYCDVHGDGARVTDYLQSEGVTSGLLQSFYSFFV